MPTIVLIEKTGTIKENNIKNLKVEDIYKKCNFRKKDDFDIRHSWNINKNLFITLYFPLKKNKIFLEHITKDDLLLLLIVQN